jgi:hypothetical protein
MMIKRDYIILGVIVFLTILGGLLVRTEDPIEQLAWLSIYVSALLIPIYAFIVTKGLPTILKHLVRVSSFYVFFRLFIFIGAPGGLLFFVTTLAPLIAFIILVLHFLSYRRKYNWHIMKGIPVVILISFTHLFLFVERMFFRGFVISWEIVMYIHLALFLLSLIVILYNRNKETGNQIKVLSVIMLPSMHHALLVLFFLITG